MQGDLLPMDWTVTPVSELIKLNLCLQVASWLTTAILRLIKNGHGLTQPKMCTRKYSRTKRGWNNIDDIICLVQIGLYKYRTLGLAPHTKMPALDRTKIEQMFNRTTRKSLQWTHRVKETQRWGVEEPRKTRWRELEIQMNDMMKTW